MKTISLAIILFFGYVSTSASTFDAVLAGKRCEESERQQIDCEYHIGKDLWISIPGIGQRDVGVTFMKADFDGDYYASFGLMHSCVIIKPGKKTEDFDFAFISPRTGKVFKSWPECQKE
jgi:hypothetical protein